MVTQQPKIETAERRALSSLSTWLETDEYVLGQKHRPLDERDRDAVRLEYVARRNALEAARKVRDAKADQS